MPDAGQRGTPSRRPLAAGLAVLAVGIAAAALAFNYWPSNDDPGEGGPTSHAPPDPRDVYDGPYLNVAKDVGYVDDAECAACHEGHAKTYAHHPMGRSLAAAGAVVDDDPFPPVQYDAAHGNPFEWQGYTYSIERDGDRVVHVETRLNDDGQVVSRTSENMKYELGAGRSARSYLFEREGRLFYSPITWYSKDETWNISPTFRGQNNRFTHGIVHDCVYCHVDRIERKPGESKFQVQGAIGCQRCHGPGELHVRRHEKQEEYDGQDYTIVNPARLTPVLRDAVCEQCHLQGDAFARFPRRGRDYADYRPGLGWHDVVATFAAVRGADAPRDGRVEQMRASRCYTASDGRLGCISCHDPHVQPSADDRVEYFRQRCLKCHEDQGCSKPLAERLEQSADDDCTQCHMPPLPTERVAHVALTDHRVPRNPATYEPPPDPPLKRRVDSPLILNLESHLLDEGDVQASRDLGIALMNLGGRGGNVVSPAVDAALPLLQAAVDRDPQDAAAWDALGRAFGSLGDSVRALDAFERALELEPRNEVMLSNAGLLTLLDGRIPQSLSFWRRAVEINPVHERSRLGLASALLNNGEYEEAIAEYQLVLKMNPAAVEAHQGIGDAVMQVQGGEAALGHYQRALQHDPNFRQARERLTEIYLEQKQWEQALVHLLAILKGSPGEVGVREAVINCYEELGDEEKAAEHRRLLDPLPDDPPPDGQ